jgi:hypothetical protein
VEEEAAHSKSSRLRALGHGGCQHLGRYVKCPLVSARLAERCISAPHAWRECANIERMPAKRNARRRYLNKRPCPIAMKNMSGDGDCCPWIIETVAGSRCQRTPDSGGGGNAPMAEQKHAAAAGCLSRFRGPLCSGMPSWSGRHRVVG